MYVIAIGSNETESERLRFTLLRCGIKFSQLRSYTVNEGVAVLLDSSVHPDIVFFQSSDCRESDCRAIAELRSSTSSVIVAVANVASARCVLEFVRAGASDCIVNADSLQDDLCAVVDRIRRIRYVNGARGIVTSVVPIGGGAGASTVAVNLSACQAKMHSSAALVELSSDGGDLETLLNVETQHSLHDLAAQIDDVDSEMLAKTMVSHDSGIHLLSSPSGGFAAPPPNAIDTVDTVLRILGAEYTHVTVELGTLFEQDKLAAAFASDQLLIVFRLEFPSLVKLSRTLRYLEEVAFPLERVRLVANRVGQRGEMRLSDSARAINRLIDFQLPDDFPVAIRAGSVGNPLVLESPQSKIAGAYWTLSKSLTPNIAASA